MTTFTEQPQSVSELYAEGMSQLGEGALSDASLTLWKAAEEAVRSYVSTADLDAAGTDAPDEIVLRRAEELGDMDLILLWCAAGSLLDNWLEHGLRYPESWVRRCAEAVRDLIEAFDRPN